MVYKQKLVFKTITHQISWDKSSRRRPIYCSNGSQVQVLRSTPVRDWPCISQVHITRAALGTNHPLSNDYGLLNLCYSIFFSFYENEVGTRLRCFEWPFLKIFSSFRYFLKYYWSVRSKIPRAILSRRSLFNPMAFSLNHRILQSSSASCHSLYIWHIQPPPSS